MTEEPVWKRNVRRLPWVRELQLDGGQCQGIKWGNVSLKHLYTMGGKPPEGIPDKARCKNPAKWSYTFLNPHYRYGKTARFCSNHLYAAGVWDDPNDSRGELARVERWFKKNGTV